MAQPPSRPVMARQVVRTIPFVTPTIYIGALAAGASISAEFDTLEGFAEPSMFASVGAYPGVNVPKKHAVGPWLDAGAWCAAASSILVEYAIDRGASYRAPVPATIVPAGGFVNLSGLRVTARFVRVTLTDGGAGGNVEFAAIMRSV